MMAMAAAMEVDVLEVTTVIVVAVEIYLLPITDGRFLAIHSTVIHDNVLTAVEICVTTEENHTHADTHTHTHTRTRTRTRTQEYAHAHTYIPVPKPTFAPVPHHRACDCVRVSGRAGK